MTEHGLLKIEARVQGKITRQWLRGTAEGARMKTRAVERSEVGRKKSNNWAMAPRKGKEDASECPSAIIG